MSVDLLRDRAYKRIRRKIVSLEYDIGSQLAEQQLCLDLGIGRTPIREALQRLATEKLVRIIPRKGIFVSDVNAWELDRLLEARTMLEVHCARKAAEAAARDQIDALRALFDGASFMVEERRIGELLEIDRNFHMGIVAVLDNPFLTEIAHKMYDQLARTWFLSFSRRSADEIRETVHEHMAIVDALAMGNPDIAEQAVLHHLERFRSKVAPRPEGPRHDLDRRN